MMVSVTSTPITVAREEVVEDGENLESNLAQIPCIQYPIDFRKKSMLAFFVSGNKVNTIYLIFAKKLCLPIRAIDIEAKKIDGITLDTFGIVVAAFSMMNKANQVRFFEKNFLVTNVNLEIVFGMLFLTLSSTNVVFLDVSSAGGLTP